jgi:hypothetical protein
MHLESDADRRAALSAVFDLLLPGGRFVFDVFTPSAANDDDGRGEWNERGHGIHERIEFDWTSRVVVISLRTSADTTTIRLAWVERDEWRTLLEATGFTIVACYGWFDLSPCSPSSAHAVWVAERGS